MKYTECQIYSHQQLGLEPQSCASYQTVLTICFSSTLPSRHLLMRFPRIDSSTLTGIAVKDMGRKSDSSDAGDRRLGSGMTSAYNHNWLIVHLLWKYRPVFNVRTVRARVFILHAIYAYLELYNLVFHTMMSFQKYSDIKNKLACKSRQHTRFLSDTHRLRRQNCSFWSSGVEYYIQKPDTQLLHNLCT